MDFNMVFPGIRLSNKEQRILYYLAEHTEQCLLMGIRETSYKCYSSSSTLIRLAHKLGFSGFTELIYFLKFNLLNPKPTGKALLDIQQVVTFYPDNGLENLISMIKHNNILLHGNGFSQLVAQYYYNRLLMLDAKVKISLWTDFETLVQNNHSSSDVVWIISKSGRSPYVMNWLEETQKFNMPVVAFTGNMLSPLAQYAQIIVHVKDDNQYDDNIRFSTPFFGYSLLAFEHLISKF